MNIQTLTGSSIQAALAEARRQLGDDVVLMESHVAQNGTPARITVMVDAPAADACPRFGYGPSAAQPTPHRRSAMAEEAAETTHEKTSGSRQAVDEEATPAMLTSPRSAHQPNRPAAAYTPRTGGRGRLFPPAGAPAPAARSSAAPDVVPLLGEHLKQLYERLDALEHRCGSTAPGAAQPWTTHSLFGLLSGCGLRPATLSSLFEALAEQGFCPEDDNDELQWAAAQILRRRLQPTAPPRHAAAGTLLLIGPSGAGKTALLLKLATHPNFYARHQPAVIAIVPEDADTLPHANPADVYRRFGLPVQSVQTEEEMRRALERVQHFDQVLIDTSPLPACEPEMRRMLARLHRLVGGLTPLRVHLVVDATRALDELDATLLKRLPLAPEAVALTHLDEARGWGRVAEWLMALQLPVAFVSDGARVPEGVRSYSPSWFVETLLEL